MEASLTQLQEDITDYIASAQQHITNLEETVAKLQASGTGDQALIDQLDQQVQAAKAAISNPPVPAAAPQSSATDPAAGATGGASAPSSAPGSEAGSTDPAAGAAGTGTPADTSGAASSAPSDAPASGGGTVTGDPGTAASASAASAPDRAVYLFTGDDVTGIDHNMWPDSGLRTPGGQTLYFFSGDTSPGDTTGDGVGGMWQHYTGPTVSV